MKPSIGRIVHYYRLADGELTPYAAIISSVRYDDDRVDLHVMQPQGNCSVACCFTVPFSQEPREGHWSWPPRV